MANSGASFVVCFRRPMMFMMWLCGVVVRVLEVETLTFSFFRTAWLSAGAESQVDFRLE